MNANAALVSSWWFLSGFAPTTRKSCEKEFKVVISHSQSQRESSQRARFSKLDADKLMRDTYCITTLEQKGRSVFITHHRHTLDKYLEISYKRKKALESKQTP